MAILDPSSMATLSAMIAEALEVAIGSAAGQARHEATATAPRVPPVSCPAFHTNEGTVYDYLGAELDNVPKFLVASKRPEEVTYENLRKILETHFDKKWNKFVKSIKFRQITQQKNENNGQFILREPRIAIFATKSSQKTQKTFDDACEIANTLEATHNTALEVNTGTPAVEATYKLGYERPKTTRSQPPPASQKHYNLRQKGFADRCLCNGGGGNHVQNQCRFRDARCRNCNKKGHIAQVCKSRRFNRDESTTDYLFRPPHYLLRTFIGKRSKWSKPSATLHFADHINLNGMFASKMPIQSLTDAESSADQKSKLIELLEDHRDIFSDIPGKLVGPPATVHLKPDASPIFSNRRSANATQ
uniref:Uncharacterized protein n=1 Tax=Anopheles stephensi TaxID=30069 RepID=A0A182YRG5_ANOST